MLKYFFSHFSLLIRYQEGSFAQKKVFFKTNKETSKQTKTNHDKTISIPYYTVVCHVVIIKHML